jgi:hypothetical protein
MLGDFIVMAVSIHKKITGFNPPGLDFLGFMLVFLDMCFKCTHNCSTDFYPTTKIKLEV